jgi:hypothetical protein
VLAFVLPAVIVLSATISRAETGPATAEPKLLSVFPSGGQRGHTVQVEVRGSFLDKTYAAWFENRQLTARFVKVEEVKNQPEQRASFFDKKDKGLLFRALVQIQIQPQVPPGVYPLRLVSPYGLSNAVHFSVVDQPVSVEPEGSHQTVDQAQPVRIPALIEGKLSKPGELDYYAFDVRQGEELRFEVARGEKPAQPEVEETFGLRLALYRAGGSYFNPHRATRILFDEQRSSDLIPTEARGTYKFREAGHYFLEVSGLYGEGCPDCTYELRMISRPAVSKLAAQMKASQTEWTERSFNRPLEDSWMTTLDSRAAGGSDKARPQVTTVALAHSGSTTVGADKELSSARVPDRPIAVAPLVAEREPNDTDTQAQNISIPCVIEGRISRPGDIDSFKFSAKPGEKLAFEIETPEAQPPHFNPIFIILDSRGRESFSNLHRSISLYDDNNKKNTYLKKLDPKVIYTFEQGGDYLLQVSDITARYGGPDFHYRLLVRPQISHVGEVSVEKADHINLVRGEARKLTITTAYEEGFAGQVSFSVSGLPAGVQAFPGAELNDDRAPRDVDESPAIVAPKQQKTTIVLLAASSAQLSSTPILIQLRCQPIADGKPGESLTVRDIPLMVVASPPPKLDPKQISAN